MHLTKYYFNYINNIIGFSLNDKNIKKFKDLINIIENNFNINLKEETENFYMVFSFWVGEVNSLWVSKKIKYFNKNTSSEINIVLFISIDIMNNLGVKTKIKNFEINQKYFNNISLDDETINTKEIDFYFDKINDLLISSLVKNKILYQASVACAINTKC
ncbi:MAG: hypothetical protein Q4B82_08340 [Alysiella sp.]|uniref:hypothetical protein n=1 Tax=Alysiella sp. TaxID=1872483 RepID=UPI0026DA8AA0|nr:hypothetical protein [Alysiella sp.]MDO4434570.1 hypothetical protein [Alysiella sp.]